jgi:hypothetical protein
MSTRDGPDQALTRGALARLLRIAANLLETTEADIDGDFVPTGVRTRRKPLPPPSELAQARARKAMRKLGMLP